MSSEQSPHAPQIIRQRTSGLAIASFVISLIGCLPWIGSGVAIVLGAVALRKINRNPQELTGRGFALAGIIIGVVLMAGTSWLTAACIKTYHSVNPIVQHLLNSMEAGDYAAARRDFHPRLAHGLPENKLAELGEFSRKRMGRHDACRWGYTFRWNKAPGEPMALVIVYKCRYTESENNVWITVSFTKHEGRYKIVGLWFNSPELRDFQFRSRQDVWLLAGRLS